MIVWEMESTTSKIQLPSSFVNEYQVALLEADDGRNGKDFLSDKRMQICFKKFDEIIPKLGIFQKVLKAIRNDLYDGVYSTNFTSSQGVGNSESVVRIPFFTLIRRLSEKRDENADILSTQIHLLETRSQDLLNTIDQSEAEASILKRSIDGLNNQIKDLEMSLSSEREAITKLQLSLKKREREYAEMDAAYKERINHLKIELQVSEEESKSLRVYKQSYDELKDAFENPYLPYQTFEFKSINEDAGRRRFTNPRIEQIQKDLLVMEKLENQLQFVRNCAIDEYEGVLESSKRRFEESQNCMPMMKELREITNDIELERESQKAVRTERTFADSILDIKAELALLSQHRNLLQTELTKLEKDDANKKAARKNKYGTSAERMNDTPTLEELDLVEIMVGNTEDPFVPHEDILNKYSSMIYTSCNEGKTFYEIPDAKFCESCGVKTLICPHLVTQRERVLSLPRNCTHIKLVRPNVKISIKGKSRERETSKVSSNENQLLPRFKLVWEDLDSRTDSERKQKRSLTEEHLLSIIDQFYGLVVWQDEHQPTEEETHSILDAFYYFLQDRYILDDAVCLVFHDILSSVEQFVAENKRIHLFAACLDGTVDAATFRYVLLMNEFITTIAWTQMQDFTVFLSIVYPFLTEDDLEQLRMGYTSFSENKVSPFLVFNYLLYMVLNGKEPRFLEFESKLLQCPVRKPGYFTDIEYAEALDSFVPLAPERLLQRLFSQSVKHFPESGEAVNVVRISHIISYLSLIHESPRIGNFIKQWKIKKSTAQNESPRANELHVMKLPGSNNKPGIMTLSRVKLLGAEMGRRSKARKSYQEQQRIALGFDEIYSQEISADES